MEAGVVVGLRDQAIYWHLPHDRSGAALPDSLDLWSYLVQNKDQISGVAHSHPWGGIPHPSHEDITTFSAVELGLGKRLQWWVVGLYAVVMSTWEGPGPYDYKTVRVGMGSPWVKELLRHSGAKDVKEK